MTERAPRVLIADDDEVALLLTQSALESGGFDVLRVEDGAAAVDTFAAERPDCVILDVMMPRMDGFAACRAIRAGPAGADVPVLIMTSRDDVDAVARAYDSGATDFASKGLSSRLLIERVRFLLREYQSRRALIISRSRLRMVQEMARVGHWEVDGVGRSMHVSRLVRSLLASNKDAGGHLAQLVAALRASDGPKLLDAFRRWQATRSPFRLETRLRTGQHLHIQGVTTQGSDSGDAATLTLAVQDITALRRAQRQAHRLANFDALTGLPNRRQFLDMLAREIANRSSGAPLAVLVFRLRGLERLQQSLGQTACDAALVGSSQALLTAVGDEGAEFLAHLGMGEFALCDPACKSPSAAAALAEEAARAFATPISGDGWTANFLVNTGIVIWPSDGNSADLLLENASTTAARGAAAPESRYEFFAAEIHKRQRRLMELESALYGALERGELSLAYQPRVGLDDFHVHGTEALMRWNHPRLGAIPPGEFITVAEESGSIVSLGSWALREACRQTGEWRRSLGRGLSVSVNVSASQLRAPRALVEDVLSALREADLPASALELELTESMAIEAAPESLAALEELRRLGVTIALDDFGTGFSSLSYLRRLPIDCLKIDRSFVSDLPDDGDAIRVLQAILAIGGALRMRTVAEGVETRAQLDTLRHHGCHEAQGYLFAQPLPAAEVEPLLAGSLAAGGASAAA
jgi:predicted signal transduction protein with EAL and GGDEF domain/CheY-like chemotaxis protein